MDLFSELIIFIVSIFVLSKASHTVIKSSVKIAKITRLGELTIGFLLLSVATTLPDLAVGFSSILSEDVGIAIGNALGANIAKICLIVGLMGLFNPMRIDERTLTRLTEILSLSSFILIMVFILSPMSTLIGIVLLILFVIFNLYSIRKKITLELKLEETLEFLTNFKLPNTFYKSLFFLIIGSAIVIASSWFVVESTSNMATILGISESIIGATIIAIGTSLPELSTALTAFREGHLKLGLGNVIGSCLTNLTLVLGVILVLAPFKFDMEIFATLTIFAIISNTLLWFFIGSIGRKKLDRREGVILLIVYFIFLITTFSLTIPGLGYFTLILKSLK